MATRPAKSVPIEGEASGFAFFSVLIPAAGTGVRFGATVPKQYLQVAGRPVLAHTLAAFDALPECRRIVLATDDTVRVRQLLRAWPVHTEISVVKGGATRQQSVSRALAEIPSEDEIVLVHDAARPCITAEEIRAVASAIREHGAALLALPSRDTVKEARADVVEGTLDRRTIHLAQTPQGARAAYLREAFRRAFEDAVEGTDESFLLERIGIRVHLVPGSFSNFKITEAGDLPLAEAVLAARRQA